MAFASAAGYDNLSNGNFSPVIYSQKVLKIFPLDLRLQKQLLIPTMRAKLRILVIPLR